MELVGRGSVINGAIPSSFKFALLTTNILENIKMMLNRIIYFSNIFELFFFAVAA